MGAGGRRRCREWSFGTRCRWRMTSVARAVARASRTGVGGRSDNVFFFHSKRPTTSSSSQSTTSSTFSALPQADRRWAHQGGRGHARADHLGPPPAGADTPIAVMREWGGARALRTDRGERLAVRRSPTRFRCGFFGPLQLHARRPGRCACGGVAPITLAVARNCARAKLERQRHRSTLGGAKNDFSPPDAK